MVQSLVRPFCRGFRVTPKGTASDRVSVNWSLAIPLLILLIGTNCSFFLTAIANFGLTVPGLDTTRLTAWNFAEFWCAYNTLILVIALLATIDVPRPNPYPWFAQQQPVQIIGDGQTIHAEACSMSELGLIVLLQGSDTLDLPDWSNQTLNLTFLASELTLPGQLITTTPVTGNQADPAIDSSQAFYLGIQFKELTLEQQRSLIRHLFCQPNQWLDRIVPSEASLLTRFIRTSLGSVITGRRPTPAMNALPQMQQTFFQAIAANSDG
ncbi:MAG: hypothetical protein AAGF24_06335 [Cyanobacteria bacterium P01_H01_bin.121]